MNSSSIKTFIEDFKESTSKPEEYLNANENFASKLKRKLKDVYDFSKLEQIKKKKCNALPELIITNFNLEQIYQQLELQNDHTLKENVNQITKFIIKKDKLLFKDLEGITEANLNYQKEIVDDDKGQDNKDDNNETQSDTSDYSDLEVREEETQSDTSSYSNLEVRKEETQSDASNYSDLEVGEDESDEGKAPEETKKRYKKSVVDDDFFKLDEMENFLNNEEKKMHNPDSGKDSDSELDSKEGSINLFEYESDEDEDDKVKTAKFKDFFKKTDETETTKKNKRNKFLENLTDTEENGGIKNQKSTLEQRHERLQKKIENLEKEAISEKPWQLKGEITADNRPQNSLLEEILEFDLTSRPAPVITEQTTLQLEDIIRQRIKDKVFDSVERKVKPVDTPLEYKKKLVLDQEKSKLSLSQIYEKEYQEQQAALDPEASDKHEEEPELHKEVKKMMRELFNKLDALSNFHFTPKPAIPELKVVTNLPAISMEEVAPVAMSEAGLLAPEEIKNKPKGDVIGAGERTATDKKRERRKKKLKQKAHLKAKEEKQKKKPRIEIGVPKKYGKGRASKIKSKK